MARCEGRTEVDVASLYDQVTMYVTVRERPITSVRVRVALWLVRLAGWVAPYHVEVER